MSARGHAIPVPRDCEECGGDRYKEREFERIISRMERIETEAIRNARNHAETEMRLRLRVLELEEAGKSMQRKSARQQKALNKMEEKLRAAGVKPYGRASVRGEETP